MRTFQTRLNLNPEQEAALDEYASLWARVEHTLFVDLQKGKESLNNLKKSYLTRFGITARQFNSARVSIEGKIRSLKEIQKQREIDLKDRLAHIEKRLSGKRSCNRHRLHQKRQRVESKLEQLAEDRASGKVHVCFGSRKRFRAQYRLEENGFQSHQDWLQKWTEARSSAFFLMGSKDETGGNQSCVGTVAEDGSLSFRLRLPNCLGQKYLTLVGLHFNHGQEVLLQALRENEARRSLQKEKSSLYRQRGLAISYRFVRDQKGWRLFASIDQPTPAHITKRELGCIGVDLNVDHLAVVETDRSGNPVASESLPLSLYGKTTEQSKALIGDTVKKLVEWAKQERKPIVIEKLDFQNKKRRLNERSAKEARMLSAFSYRRTLEMIKVRACREGVQVIEVNAAYTSQIGKIKFAKRYGLSIHHAAALCIARRAPGFSEKLPRHSDVPSGKGTYVAFAVPVRNQQRSFWSYLGEVTRKLRVALAEHLRVTKCQSVGPPAPA